MLFLQLYSEHTSFLCFCYISCSQFHILSISSFPVRSRHLIFGISAENYQMFYFWDYLSIPQNVSYQAYSQRWSFHSDQVKLDFEFFPLLICTQWCWKLQWMFRKSYWGEKCQLHLSFHLHVKSESYSFFQRKYCSFLASLSWSSLVSFVNLNIFWEATNSLDSCCFENYTNTELVKLL